MRRVGGLLSIPEYFYPLDATCSSYILEAGSLLFIHSGDKDIRWIGGTKAIFYNHNTALVLSFGTLYLLDINNGKLRYNLPMRVMDFHIWSRDTLILLGNYNGKIFHIIPLYPEYIKEQSERIYHRITRSFGEYPEMVFDELAPLQFAVSETHEIFVPSINAYKIYHYKGDTLMDTIIHPDVNRIPPMTFIEDTACIIVYNLGGINGIAYFDGKLYISGYRYSSLTGTRNPMYWMDIYDLQHNKWTEAIKDDLLVCVTHSDKTGVYLIHAGRVERWR